MLDLPAEFDTGTFHLNGERALINDLLETRPQSAVQFHGATNYQVGEIIVDHRVVPLRLDCHNQDLLDFGIVRIESIAAIGT